MKEEGNIYGRQEDLLREIQQTASKDDDGYLKEADLLRSHGQKRSDRLKFACSKEKLLEMFEECQKIKAVLTRAK